MCENAIFGPFKVQNFFSGFVPEIFFHVGCPTPPPQGERRGSKPTPPLPAHFNTLVWPRPRGGSCMGGFSEIVGFGSGQSASRGLNELSEPMAVGVHRDDHPRERLLCRPLAVGYPHLCGAAWSVGSCQTFAMACLAHAHFFFMCRFPFLKIALPTPFWALYAVC